MVMTSGSGYVTGPAAGLNSREGLERWDN
jgi:hypothetical protein